MSDNAWIKVEDRLPEQDTTDIGGEYLVVLGYPYDRVAAMNYEKRDGDGFGAGWFTGGWGKSKTSWNNHVTHWMPLPQLPSDENLSFSHLDEQAMDNLAASIRLAEMHNLDAACMWELSPIGLSISAHTARRRNAELQELQDAYEAKYHL